MHFCFLCTYVLKYSYFFLQLIILFSYKKVIGVYFSGKSCWLYLLDYLFHNQLYNLNSTFLLFFQSSSKFSLIKIMSSFHISSKDKFSIPILLALSEMDTEQHVSTHFQNLSLIQDPVYLNESILHIHKALKAVIIHSTTQKVQQELEDTII